ncbi:MAG TPA: response regulator transcription factor [Candidatus Hydrogenedentes bacterium]|nr:response regulator transcription factor [Candidatus Hydrogenedentota bacterium]
MRSSEAIHVLIIDDHPAVRQGLALLLEPEGIMVCGEASGCAEALEHLDEFQPDVVLVDLSLGDEDGMSLLGCLCDRHVPCMVYSMYEDGWHVERAFAAGALGYVTKREVHKVLVEAIGEVAAGRRFVSPKAAIALADQVADKQASISGLSSQEQQVYRLLGEGESTRAIATTMKVSPRTVESYYARILIKLGLEGMRELRRNAISHHHDQTH